MHNRDDRPARQKGQVKMELSYLERLLELLEKLERAVLIKNAEEMEVLCEKIERHTDPFEKFIDMLDECESKYGSFNNYTKQAIDEANGVMQIYHGQPYRGLWLRFANEKFLSELKRWVKEASGQEKDGQGRGGKEQRLAPLSENQTAVYDLLKNLPEYKAMTGKEILRQLEDEKAIIMDQSTLTKNIIPALRPYGVKNKRGAGYYIDK